MNNFIIALLFTLSLAGQSVADVLHPQDTSSLCPAGTTGQTQLGFRQSIEQLNKDTLTVLTWNAHKLENPRFYPDIKSLSEKTDIIFMQEAMHTLTTESWFALQLPFDWSFHKSFCMSGEATGVMTGSRFPMIDSRTITSRGTEPVVYTPKVSGVSTIVIQNQPVLLINTHALNFNSGRAFEDQIDQIIEIITKASTNTRVNVAVIWAGDFNTWNPIRRSYLFNQARSVGLEPLIPKNDPRKLKLDHILVRGLKVLSVKVLGQYQTSDHLPVEAELSF